MSYMALFSDDAARSAAMVPTDERLLSTCHDLLAYAGKQGMSLAELCDHIRRTGKYPLPRDDVTARKEVEDALSSSDQFVLFLNRYTLLSIFVTGLELRRVAPQNVVAVQSDGRTSSVSGAPYKDGGGETGGECDNAVAAFSNQHHRKSPGEDVENAPCEPQMGTAGPEYDAVLSSGGRAMSSHGGPESNGERGSAVVEERGPLRIFGAMLDLNLNAPPEKGDEAEGAEPELDLGASTTMPKPLRQEHDLGPHKAFPFADPGEEWSDAQLKLVQGRANMPLTSFVLGDSRAADGLPRSPTARACDPVTPLERSFEFPTGSSPSQRPPQHGIPPTNSPQPGTVAGALGLLQAYDSDEENSDEESDCVKAVRGSPTNVGSQREGVVHSNTSEVVEDQSAEEESGIGGRSACKRCGVSIPEGRKVCDEHSVWAKRRVSKQLPLPPEKEGSSGGDGSGLGADETEPPLAKCKYCEDQVEPGLRLCAKHNPWTKRRQIAIEAGKQEAESGVGSSRAGAKCYIVVGDRRNFCETHGKWADLCTDSGGAGLTTGSYAQGDEDDGGGKGETKGRKRARGPGKDGPSVSKRRKGKSKNGVTCEKCVREARPGSALCKYHLAGIARSKTCQKMKRQQEMWGPSDDRKARKRAPKGGPAAGPEPGGEGEAMPRCRQGRGTCTRPAVRGSKLCWEHYSCLAGVKRLSLERKPTPALSGGVVKRRASAHEDSGPPGKRAKVPDDKTRMKKTLREIKRLGAGMSIEFGNGKRKAADAVRAKYAEQRAKRARRGAAARCDLPPLTSSSGGDDVSAGRADRSAEARNRCIARDGRRTWQCREAAIPGETRCRHHFDQYEGYKRQWRAKTQLAREKRTAGVTSPGDATDVSKGCKREKAGVPLSRGAKSSHGGARRCHGCGKPAQLGMSRCKKCNDLNTRQTALYRARKKETGDGGQGRKWKKEAGGAQAQGKEGEAQEGERKCKSCKRPAVKGKQNCAKHVRMQNLYYRRWYAARKAAGQPAKPSGDRKAGQAKAVTGSEWQGRTRLNKLETSQSGGTKTGGGGASGKPRVGALPARPVDPPGGGVLMGQASYRRCRRVRNVKGELVRCVNEAEEGEYLCELHSDWMQQQLAKRQAKADGKLGKGSGKGKAEEAEDRTLGEGSGNVMRRTEEGAEEAEDGTLGNGSGNGTGRTEQGAEGGGDGPPGKGSGNGTGRTEQGAEEAKDGRRKEVRLKGTGKGAAPEASPQKGAPQRPKQPRAGVTLAVLALPMPRVDSRKRQSQPNPATAERVEGPVATVSSRPPEEESWRAIGEGFSEGGGSKHSNSDPGVGAPAMSAGGSVAEGGGGAKAESRPPGPASWRADWQRAADGKKLMLHAGGGSGAGEKWRGGSA